MIQMINTLLTEMILLTRVSALLPKSLEFIQKPIKIGKIYLMAQFSLLTKAYVIEGVSRKNCQVDYWLKSPSLTFMYFFNFKCLSKGGYSA